MRKTIMFVMMIITLFMCASCNVMLQSPDLSADIENFELTAEILSEYTVVYPDTYNDCRMEDVYSLRTATEDFCGADINVISDKEEYSGKKIILASSSQNYFCREKINSYYGTLNYAIAFDSKTKDIIIGGANYYADMLAINDFCNNYLNNGSTIKIKEFTEVNISKNEISVTACMLTAPAFLEYGCFVDMVKAGFNTVLVDASVYTETQMHELVKWCAMSNTDIVMRGILYTNMYFDSPNVKGHLIVDDPYGEDAYEYYSEECRKYTDTYGDFSWQPYINIIAQDDVIMSLKNSNELFDSVEKLSFKLAVDSPRDMVKMYFKLLTYTRNADKKYIAGINVDMPLKGYTQYEMMRLMSNVGLCFGADGIEYFNYCGADDFEYGTLVDGNFNKRDAWHYAVEINYEAKNIGTVLHNYEYSGSYMIYNSYTPSIYGEPLYNDTFKNNIEIVYGDDEPGKFLVGSFDNELTGNIAYTILNLETQEEQNALELYISTENTRIWVDGNIMNTSSDNSDRLKIVLGGTECIVVEVLSNE